MTETYIVLFKMLGSVLILSSTGYFAFSANQVLEKRKRELRGLYSILVQLKSEIQYMYNPLPECFAKLEVNQKDPFAQWMGRISERLMEKEGETFSEIWTSELTGLYEHSALEKQDVEPLYELGDKLGAADVDAQMQAIDYAVLHMEKNRKELENELVQRKKIITTMSLFCGFIALIVLL